MSRAGTGSTGQSGEVARVAAAMLRYALPGMAGGGLWLGGSRDGGGTWLRLIRPVCETAPGAPGDPGELTLIDRVACRWGSCGGTELPATLWVLLA